MSQLVLESFHEGPLEGHHLSQQSNADSASLLREHDSQSSLADSQDITPNTSLSQKTERGAFKKPKKSSVLQKLNLFVNFASL
jgi:hypothetical protein